MKSFKFGRAKRLSAAMLWLALLVGFSFSQSPGQTLTNDDVVRMVEAGLSPELIAVVIAKSPCEFTTDVDAILALKAKKVPEKILQAMLQKQASNKPRLLRKENGPSSDRSSLGEKGFLPPDEIGVYYLDETQEEFIPFEPEIVTWKTGGFLKSLATAGLNGRHLNGVVHNKTSRYSLKGIEELYIRCSPGVSGNEYQLLHLWEKKNRREFRTMTGGVVNASGGANENRVYFEPQRVESGIYKFKLPGLAPGEYGLLPPGAAMAASKIYAFSVGR